MFNNMHSFEVRHWKLLFWILPILLCDQLSAQIKVSGCITEEGSKKPLIQVIVQNENGSNGDVTDDNGCFRFNVEKLPVEIYCRLIGYIPKKFLIASTEPVLIEMVKSDIVLPEIRISSENTQRVAGNTHRSIWDYAWLDNALLLCEYGTTLSKSKLILMTTNGDTICTSDAPDRPISLINDCSHAAHFMSRDSLWEYYTAGNKLRRFPGQSSSITDRVLQYCVGQNQHSIFFAVPSGRELRLGDDPYAFRYETNNDKMKYFLFDRKTEKLNLIKTIEDNFTLALKKDEMEYGNGPHAKPSPESAFSKAASKYFFWKVMCKEVDAPMYQVQDSLYILDHINGLMEVLDENGEFVRSVAIDYHLHPEYQRQSICDEEARNLYAVFEKDGMYVLHHINLVTGALQEKFIIPQPFPEHISIRRNVIYYLTRDEKNHEAHVLNRMNMNNVRQ